MNKKFARKLKSELAIRMGDAMNGKGIATYDELIRLSGVSINNHFSDVLKGKQAIKEDDLLKISRTLDIPMEFFYRMMKKEVKYRVEEYIPIETILLDEEKKLKLREYNRIYKRKQRARIKAQKEVV